MTGRFLACFLLLAAAACGGGADPGDLTSGRARPGQSTVDPTSPTDPAAGNAAPADSTSSSSGGGATPTSGSSSSSSSSSSGSVAADGGTSSSSGSTPPPPANAFSGAAAYAAKLGPSARQGAHTGVGGPQNLDCANCHNWLIGGTVWMDAAGTMPAPSVEVRVRDAAGNAASAYTDQDGNFYLPAGTGGVTLPAEIGVRNGTTTKLMGSTLSAGGCAAGACHVSGKQGVIHLQ